MKTYVLTEHERDILKEFLKSRTREKGFKMLLHRIRKNHDKLEADLRLIAEVKEIANQNM